jgi:ribonucleoside-diphosphate reductase alpha chain
LKLVDKFIFTRFEPSGRVADHDTLRTATSIVDLVMRVLAVHYLKRTDLQHVQMEVVEDLSAPPSPAHDATTGFTDRSGDGPPCPDCGWITKRNGTCHRCPNCGLSLGCS